MQDIVERVKAFLAERPDVAPDRLVAHTKYAATTLRHVLDGMRPASAEVAAELERVLRDARAGEIFPADVAAITLPESRALPIRAPRRPREIFLTETLRKVGQSLTYCAEHAAIGVVTATYGAGKTEAIRHWREHGEGYELESCVFEFDDFSASNAVDFVERLADLVGVEYKRGPHNGGRTLRALCAHLVEHPCLLIMDQCEAVRGRVMQIMRQIWDHTHDAGVGMVLLAAPVLMERMQASRIQDLEALRSRVAMWVQLRGLSVNEMAAILKSEGITAVDDAAFRLWHRATGGSMRRLMASIDLIKAKHAGRPITEKTLSGVAAYLWGLNIGFVEPTAEASCNEREQAKVA
jgi:type II secretory pathway predicted ATPase ExeA